MNYTPDITTTIIFHREGAFAIPALASLADMIRVARAAGISVETQAILDRPDALTRRLVAAQAPWLDTVEEVSFGDLGLSRNAGTVLAKGRFLAFLDGDDLWGECWLQAAFAATIPYTSSSASIWHPESLYFFSEGDFNRASTNDIPSPTAQSFHLRQQASDMPGFTEASLILNNLWSANVFAERELHLRFPYGSVDRDNGFGVEDWSWNLETLWNGVSHRIVPDTVHLIRQKEHGSLGQQNTVEGLLPLLPQSFEWQTALSKRPT